MTARLLLLLLVAIGYASACSPAQKDNIVRLKKFFGIEPFYPNGQFDTNGQTNEYILKPADLNCNFNTDESPQSGSNAQSAALCKWKNMKGERNDIDSEQFYLFTKTDNKQKWNILNPNRGAARQTPATGDGFALTGGEGKPPPQSIYYSSPIKCSKNPTTLSFDYWLFSGAELEVLVLEKDTYKTLFTSPAGACGKVKPKDGKCIITIPPQSGPYHLAVHGYNLNKQFAIIDNIAYAGELGKECEGGGNPFDFGTTGATLGTRTNQGFITTATDLNCAGDSSCKWSNSPNGDVMWEKHTAPVDADKWLAATGDSTTPSGDFFMARSKTGKAELMSDKIECQSGDGVVTFKAWASEGTVLEVCAVDANTFANIFPCERIYTPMTNGEPFVVPLFGPLNNFRIMFVGSDWNAGNGGMVAVDDIEYEATMCSEVPPPTTTASPDDTVCQEISTDFDQSTVSTSAWQPYPGTAYQSHPLVKAGINPAVKTAQNTQVECPDGTKCAGAALDKAQNQVTIMQTKEFQPLTQPRFLQMNARRGTFNTTIVMCTNKLPNFDSEGRVTPDSNCQIVSGPELTYDEYRHGKVTGGTLPKGTKQVFIVFNNPVYSGAEKAGFLVDDVQLLRDDTSNSGPLCEQGSKA